MSCLPVSLFSAIAGGELTLADWLAFAAELGLDGVECSPVLVRPRGPATPAEYRRLAAARGLVVSNYTCYSDFTQPDPAARRREVAAMVENVQAAVELGSPFVRALTGQRRPGVGVEEGVAWVVESIREVAAAADQLGVRLVVENHSKAFVWTDFDFAERGEVYLKVMDGLRDTSVGVMFDTANPLVAGEDPLPLLDALLDRVAVVHVNDVRRPGAFEFVPAGSGIAPIGEALARLRRRGFDGWVAVEEASRTGHAGFRQGIGRTRALWAAAAPGPEPPGRKTTQREP